MPLNKKVYVHIWFAVQLGFCSRGKGDQNMYYELIHTRNVQKNV